MKSPASGFALLGVLGVLAAVTAVTWLLKPSAFPGASKRAQQSTQATANLAAANDAQSAAAAASVVKIGEANAVAPDSPSKDFTGREVGVALSYLRKPDPQKLIEAEQRKVAIMEGKVILAQQLYEKAGKQSAQIQRELDAANAARHAADMELEKAAAAEHARTVQLAAAVFVAVMLLLLWGYTKLYHVSPEVIGTMAAEIRAGGNPIHVFNSNLSPRHYARVSRAAKLATELK